MATVIDQFAVKYTLDTSDLDKKTKDTERKLNNLKNESKEAGSTLGDAVEAGAKRAGGSLGVIGSMLGKGGMIGLAIGSLAYVAGVIDDKMFGVARSLQRLGINSKNLGIAASEMRNLQNMSELAGGSLEDATNDVGGLQKSLFNLKFNGQVSESLIMLSRLGVQFQDSYGRARDFGDIMGDTAAKIEEAKKAGRMTDAEGYQFALQAGFSGGDANLVNSGTSNLRNELAKQQARRQVQAGDISAANRWVRASQSLGQATEAGVGNAAMGTYGNGRARADETVESAGGYIKDGAEYLGVTLVKGAEKIGDALDKSLMFLAKGVDKAITSEQRAGMGRVGSTASGLTRGLRNNNPLNLKALPGQRADADGFAIFNTMDEGIRAADRQLSINETKHGATTLGAQVNRWAPSSENDVPAYLASLKKQTGMDPNSPTAGHHEQMIAAMALHESGAGAPNLATVQRAMGTNVQIGDINIHTQATDATGIASNIGDALTKRKLLTANAEQGGT